MPIFISLLVAFFSLWTPKSLASEFLTGANLIDWECAHGTCLYGHDLGTNDWARIHMSMHGYRSESTFRKTMWIKMLDDLKSIGANFARIPGMTEGQGILWNDWRPGVTDSIRGIDPVWMKNIRFLLNEAHKRGIQVQISLLTGNTPRSEGDLYNFYHGKNQIILNAETRRSYFEKIVGPFFDAFGNHPALVHVDLFGEANGAISEGKDSILESDVRRFIREQTAYIRARFPSLRVALTASFGYHPTPFGLYIIAGNTGLDFYQIHLYEENGMIEHCDSWKTMDLPVMLGEFGSPSPRNGDSEAGLLSRAHQARITANFLSRARTCGLMGAAPWAMDPGPGNTERDRFNNPYDNQGKLKPEITKLLSNSARNGK